MQPKAQQERGSMRFPRAIPQEAAEGCRAQRWDLLWQPQFGYPPGRREVPPNLQMLGGKLPAAAQTYPPLKFRKKKKKIIWIIKSLETKPWLLIYMCGVCVCKSGIEGYSLSHTWRSGCSLQARQLYLLRENPKIAGWIINMRSRLFKQAVGLHLPQHLGLYALATRVLAMQIKQYENIPVNFMNSMGQHRKLISLLMCSTVLILSTSCARGCCNPFLYMMLS